MFLLEFAHGCLHLLSNHQDGLFSRHARVFAVLIVDVAKTDVRSVVLQEPKIRRARDGCREMEVQVALATLLLTVQSAVRRCEDLKPL